MSARTACAAVTLLFAAQVMPAFACGHCVEDKIASVYDHAVVTRALSLKHHVLFFAIDGRLTGTAAERGIVERAAASAYGVDAGSARVSTKTASLSVAVDPRRTPVAAVARSLQRKLAPSNLTVQLVRVMDKPAEFKGP